MTGGGVAAGAAPGSTGCGAGGGAAGAAEATDSPELAPNVDDEDDFSEGLLEVDKIVVCGLELRLPPRRRKDYYAACSGDLPVNATGVLPWECGRLLAEYVCYAPWVARRKRGDVGPREAAPWWMLHPPAPIVPSRFWGSADRGVVLELGGGCGVVAAALASFGANVLCTDGDPAALAAASATCKQAEATRVSTWGSVRLAQFAWGTGSVADARVAAYGGGPVEFVVGSDLLYGDSSPPGGLLDTLAALAKHPATRCAEVLLALKNRCKNEVDDFTAQARQRDLWDVSMADPEDFPDGYDARFVLPGHEEGDAYGVVHMRVKRDPSADLGAAPGPTAVQAA